MFAVMFRAYEVLQPLTARCLCALDSSICPSSFSLPFHRLGLERENLLPLRSNRTHGDLASLDRETSPLDALQAGLGAIAIPTLFRVLAIERELQGQVLQVGEAALCTSQAPERRPARSLPEGLGQRVPTALDFSGGNGQDADDEPAKVLAHWLARHKVEPGIGVQAHVVTQSVFAAVEAVLAVHEGLDNGDPVPGED